MRQDRQRPRNGGASNKRSGSGGGGWYRAPQGKPSQGAPRPRTGVHGSHLEHLDKVLARLLHFAAPADMVVSQYFREHHELGHRERGIIAEAAFAVLRRTGEFGQFSESGAGPARRRLVLLGLLQTAGRAAIAPFLNPAEAEWLDRWENRDRAALAPRVRANLPDWLFDALVAQHGADFTEALAQAWLAPAPLDLRVNTLKGERDAFIMEMPLYHVPNARTIAIRVWQRMLAFVRKATTVILSVSVVVSALAMLPHGVRKNDRASGIRQPSIAGSAVFPPSVERTNLL